MATLDASLTGKAGEVVVVNATENGFETVTTGGSLFGSAYFNGNGAPTSIATAATYVILDPGIWATTVTDTITFTTHSFTVPNTGIYEISMSISFSGGGGGAGNIYRFAFFRNGSLISSSPVARRQTASGDIGSVSLSTMQQLTAGDDVAIYVQNESGINDPTISDASFTIVLLRES